MSEDGGTPHPPRIDCVLVCGGVWHVMDFARLELLKLLAEDERVRTRSQAYRHAAAEDVVEVGLVGTSLLVR